MLVHLSAVLRSSGRALRLPSLRLPAGGIAVNPDDELDHNELDALTLDDPREEDNVIVTETGLAAGNVDEVELPDPRDVGVTATWVLGVGDGRPGSSAAVEVPGRFIGFASSRRDWHTHDGQFARGGERCAACRWFEPRIFRLDDDARPPTYVLYTAGRSVVPDETTLARVTIVHGSLELIEALTTRHAATGTVSLTNPAARVLAQAASYDPDILEAYQNRAVS